MLHRMDVLQAFPHPDQHGAHFVQSTFRRLNQVDGGLGIPVRHHHTVQFSPEPLRNAESRSIIRCTVDSKPRGQALEPLPEIPVIYPSVTLDVNTRDVGIHSERHRNLLVGMGEPLIAQNRHPCRKHLPDLTWHHFVSLGIIFSPLLLVFKSLTCKLSAHPKSALAESHRLEQELP